MPVNGAKTAMAPDSAFAGLLKRYREAAGLSQEALAERAGLSPRGVKYLEAGGRKPYKDTLQRLAEALALAPADRAELIAATRPGGGSAALAGVAARPAHNLPAPLTSFIGRQWEQEQVRGLLQQARLITLTGAGGAGKTRLALAVAGGLIGTYPDGVWLVELAALADPTLVPQTVGAALGLREEPGRSIQATLVEHLAGSRLLLLLDNCEHLVGACAELAAALLRGCPELHILTTSREGLGVPGETTFRVPSLAVPDWAPSGSRLPAPEQLARYEAVQLFVERAQAQRPDFALIARTAPAVVEICARLDGIPLAIELAAARVGTLPVADIAARLGDRFRLLTGGPRTALPRQQTLRAALDWSHDLLDGAERCLLRRLAVFAGGWTIEAAEAVCAGDGLEEWAVLDLLGALVTKSLVLLEESAEHARYRLLETVRQYGWEKLDAAGETGILQDRHLAWYRGLAERAEPALLGPDQQEWLERLEQEHDNLRAALRWSMEAAGRAADAIGLAAALGRFWYIHGHLNEGLRWLEEALAREGAADVPGTFRAPAYNSAGNLAYLQGQYRDARALHEEGLALSRELGDARGIAGSLGNLGNVAMRQGNYGRVEALYRECLTLFRELGDRSRIASALGNLGNVAYFQADYARAEALLEESLAFRRELADTWGIANSLNALGSVVERRGEYGRAEALQQESLALFRELGDQAGIANALTNLGSVAERLGDRVRAEALHRQGLILRAELGDKHGIADSLDGLALLAQTQGQARWGAQLIGAADALRLALGAPRPPSEQPRFEWAVTMLRTTLGEEEFAAALSVGRALPLDEAISAALSADAGI